MSCEIITISLKLAGKTNKFKRILHICKQQQKKLIQKQAAHILPVSTEFDLSPTAISVVRVWSKPPIELNKREHRLRRQGEGSAKIRSRIPASGARCRNCPSVVSAHLLNFPLRNSIRVGISMVGGPFYRKGCS